MRRARVQHATIQITCPCCGSILTIAPELRQVISHEAPAHPPKTCELREANQWLEAQAERREDHFRKSAEVQKAKAELLNQKFQEALKEIKGQDQTRPIREIDLD